MVTSHIQKQRAHARILRLVLWTVNRDRRGFVRAGAATRFLEIPLCGAGPYAIDLRVSNALLIVDGLPDELILAIPTVDEIQDEYPPLNPQAEANLTVAEFTNRVVDWLAGAEPNHPVFGAPMN